LIGLLEIVKVKHTNHLTKLLLWQQGNSTWRHFPFKTLLRTFSGHILVILAAERTRGRGIPQRTENLVHL
jgi:hypothetical protein